jgi:hypothetical protein
MFTTPLELTLTATDRDDLERLVRATAGGVLALADEAHSACSSTKTRAPTAARLVRRPSFLVPLGMTARRPSD